MQGEIQRARLEVQPQIASLRAYGWDPWNLSRGLSLLADIDKTEGNLDAARRNYEEAREILKKANTPIANPQVALAELFITGGRPENAEPLIREAIADLEKNKSAGDELGGYTSLGRALLAQGKITEAREAVDHAFKLADLHEFPVLRLPLQLLHARVAAAAAPSGNAGARREMADVIQKSHQLGLYNTECEARLAFGQLELRRNPATGRAQLTNLATEARSHGLALLARQAEQAITAVNILADNRQP